MSAINTYSQFHFEEDGEGIAYTDDYFYAYYRNIDNIIIPFASVSLKSEESKELAEQIINELKDGQNRKEIKQSFDTFVMGLRDVKAENNANNGNNDSLQTSNDNGRMGSRVLRKGRYYDHPDLYVKTIPTNGWGEGIDAEDATLSRIEQESSKTYEEITKIELIESPTTDESSSPLDVSTNSITTTKLLQGVEKSYDKGKKN